MTEYKSLSIIILGATGAVGGEIFKELIRTGKFKKLTLLGRSKVDGVSNNNVYQHSIDIFNQDTYVDVVSNHDAAICTLGVGQPSKISREEFVKIDKKAVLDFAKACKKVGIRHFQLLSSVGINAKSPSFFLRTKGELVEELIALQFERLSVFQPSMILTPTNRYGFSQALTLAIWPWLNPILSGPLKKYRGVRVEQLGKVIASNTFFQKEGLEMLDWVDFQKLTKRK